MRSLPQRSVQAGQRSQRSRRRAASPPGLRQHGLLSSHLPRRQASAALQLCQHWHRQPQLGGPFPVSRPCPAEQLCRERSKPSLPSWGSRRPLQAAARPAVLHHRAVRRSLQRRQPRCRPSQHERRHKLRSRLLPTSLDLRAQPAQQQQQRPPRQVRFVVSSCCMNCLV